MAMMCVLCLCLLGLSAFRHSDCAPINNTNEREVEQLARDLRRLLHAPDKETKVTADIYDEEDGADETVDLDLANKKEVVTIKDGPAAGSIIVVDEDKGIVSLASTSTNECYLIGGVDKDIPSVEDMKQQLLHENGQSKIALKPTALAYKKQSLATNTAILADEVKDFCKDKSVYWLTKMTEAEAKDVKRGWFRKLARWGARHAVSHAHHHMDGYQHSGSYGHDYGHGYHQQHDPNYHHYQG